MASTQLHWHRGLTLSRERDHRTGLQDNSFTIAVDTEKIAHLASSGENLSNTSTIFLKFKNVGVSASDLPTRVHLIAQFDAIVEVRATTVELFE